MDSSCFDQNPLSVFVKEYEAALLSADEATLRRKSMEAWEFEDSYAHQISWRAMMYGMNQEDQARWLRENAGSPEIPMGPYHQNRPSGLYENMVKKIAPFPVKGVLWYQGESDSGHGDIYDKTFAALIHCWRELWQDDLPFLFVQLAPFGSWLGIEGQNYPAVRESQDRVSKTVKGTGMISIMDLGLYEDIHPKRKMEVGERTCPVSQRNGLWRRHSMRIAGISKGRTGREQYPAVFFPYWGNVAFEWHCIEKLTC